MLMFVHIALMIYIGLVAGIHLKFTENGLRVTKHSFILVSMLPFIIIGLHGAALVKFAIERRAVRFRQLFFPALKFPLIVGVFIELLLEKQAQAVAAKSRTLDKTKRVNKKIRNINSVRRTVEFDFEIIKDATSLYKKKLMPKEAI